MNPGHSADFDAPVEPTSAQWLAAVAAWNEVEVELGVTCTATRPVQGEAMHKVFAYRIAKAVLNTRPTPPGGTDG